MSHRKASVNINDLFSKDVDVEVCLKSLKIYQKLEGDANCVVWDAALVLAKYLETMCQHKADFLSGMKVLELGSGPGVVGLTAATLGAQVTLTDLPDVLTLLKFNITENKAKVMSMGGYAIAESLVWGDTTSDIMKEEFDLVLLSDCVYYEEGIDPLIHKLLHINKSSIRKPTVYLTQELFDTDEKKSVWQIFNERLNDNFTVYPVPEEQQHPNYRSKKIALLKVMKK